MTQLENLVFVTSRPLTPEEAEHWKSKRTLPEDVKPGLRVGVSGVPIVNALPAITEADKARWKAERERIEEMQRAEMEEEEQREWAHAKADFEGMDPREFAEWLLDSTFDLTCCGDSHFTFLHRVGFAYLYGVDNPSEFDPYKADITDEVRARLYAKLGIDG